MNGVGISVCGKPTKTCLAKPTGAEVAMHWPSTRLTTAPIALLPTTTYSFPLTVLCSVLCPLLFAVDPFEPAQFGPQTAYNDGS